MAKQLLGLRQIKFVEALESGNYLQTFGALRRIRPGPWTSYCALGVAREVVDGFDDPHWRRFYNLADRHDIRFLHLNDVQRLTFPEIAAAIRANPENFFGAPA